MKIRTILIAGVVSAALIGGVGYGVYYSMQSQKKPVEVVSVSNVNTGYWGMTDSIYGNVTSQVAQIVNVNDEYPIAEIYVQEGDEVKEGTPLFSYDMTLPELELEMEELSLQTQELIMIKLEKDLEKLKKTNVSASLVLNQFQLTAASDMDLLIEPLPEETSDVVMEFQTDETETGEGVIESEDSVLEIQIDGIETIESADELNQSAPAESEPVPEEKETEAFTEADEKTAEEKLNEAIHAMSEEDAQDTISFTASALVYEALVKAIGELYEEYETELRSDELSDAVRSAVKYYRKHLADKKVTEETREDDSVIRTVSYEIKKEVWDALGEEDTKTLIDYSLRMDSYQTRYVEMMIREAGALSGEKLLAAVEKIQEEYDHLSTECQENVQNLSEFEHLKELAEEYKASLDQTDPPTGDESESESESETETESEITTESEIETETESEITTESETETETESEITTESESETETESESTTESESESESESETATESESESETEPASEKMTESESETESETEIATELSVAITDFQTRAEMIFMEGAQPTVEDCLAAIDLYQQFLALPKPEMISPETNAKMEEYVLTDEAMTYLNAQSAAAAQETADAYQQICFTYVKLMVTKMDPKALTREELTAAVEAYTALGMTWQSLLEMSWQEEQAALGTGIYPSLLDYLTAYDLILRIQELDLNQSRKAIKKDLRALKEAYFMMTESQKAIVWNSDYLISLLKKYDLWDIETEPQTEPDWDDGWDDWGDDWGDEYYSAEELKEMIRDKEREIKECELEIKETQIAVRKQQRIVEGKIVKSTMDGTVISIGDLDGNSDEDYFAKVANDKGLYAKGTMSELALEKIKVGDTISGVMTDSGMSFTAVIKEISPYPEKDNSGYYGYGSENSNASHYPFYALINDSEDLEEGEAEIQLSETMVNEMDAIYLELYFVRTDNNGKSYVMKQGENGLLTKQIVETGKTVSNYAVEIVSGLSHDDRIAFPYGDDVFEGAQTKEVDMLEAAYM